MGFARFPGHFFFAILMGYFYSLAHFTHHGMYRWLVIVAPVLAHGLYDAMLMVAQVLPDIAMFLTLGVIFLLNRLRHLSKAHITHLLKKGGVI